MLDNLQDTLKSSINVQGRMRDDLCVKLPPSYDMTVQGR